MVFKGSVRVLYRLPLPWSPKKRKLMLGQSSNLQSIFQASRNVESAVDGRWQCFRGRVRELGETGTLSSPVSLVSTVSSQTLPVLPEQVSEPQVQVTRHIRNHGKHGLALQSHPKPPAPLPGPQPGGSYPPAISGELKQPAPIKATTTSTSTPVDLKSRGRIHGIRIPLSRSLCLLSP